MEEREGQRTGDVLVIPCALGTGIVWSEVPVRSLVPGGPSYRAGSGCRVPGRGTVFLLHADPRL